MAGITLIFSAFERNLVLSLGADVQKDDKDGEKEIIVIESQADTTIQRVIGFGPNEEEEDEDDTARTRVPVGFTPHVRG